MDNLNYSKLKLQEYFKHTDVNIFELRNTFKFRVRMVQFGEILRGSAEYVCCPLCSSHLDNQDMLFKCPSIKEKIKVNIDVKKIYTGLVNNEEMKELTKLLRMRKTLLESG